MCTHRGHDGWFKDSQGHFGTFSIISETFDFHHVEIVFSLGSHTHLHKDNNNPQLSLCHTASIASCTFHLLFLSCITSFLVSECTKWAINLSGSCTTILQQPMHEKQKQKTPNPLCSLMHKLTSIKKPARLLQSWRERAFLTAFSESCCSVSSSSTSILNSRLSDLSVHPWGKRHMRSVTKHVYAIVFSN